MKKYWPFACTYFILLMAGCHKNDDSPVARTFDLLEVPDGAINVEVNPILSRVPVIFDENETIYDLYLGKGPDLITPYSSGIAATSFQINNLLYLSTANYCKVISKDENGNEAYPN